MIGWLVLICAVRNLPWNLDDYDQAKQAFVSLEMVGAGEWWFQHTPSGKIATKPPLAGWISAALVPLFGWDLAWRLPSFLAAAILGTILWRSASRILPGAGGILALGIFGFTLLTPRIATLVRTDMLLALWIFLAGWMVWDRMESGRPWTSMARVGLALVVAAALLTKGPILYAFLLPVQVVWTVLRRLGRVELRMGSGWWPWVLPMGLFALWVGAGIALSPEFKEQVVVREFLGRFTTGEQAVHRSQPVWFYVVHLLHKLAPWSLLGLWLGWRVARAPRSDPGAVARLRESDRWLALWLLGGLIVMSAIPSKRVDRVFALVPMLALLIPALIRAAGGWHPMRRILRVALAIAAVAAGGYAVARPIQAWRADEGALVRFCTEARALALDRGWRLAVVRSAREGVTVYLREPKPLPVLAAAAAWNRGELDAVVGAESDLKKAGWQPRGRVALSGGLPGAKERFVLLVREESARLHPPAERAGLALR